MESIEQRAWDYAVQYRQGDSVFAEGYIQGATEQKAIDYELLKRVHKGVLDKAIKEKKELIDKACGWLKKYCGMNEYGLVQFRKAMEK